MIILGIDPSLSSTGYSINDDGKIVGSGRIKTETKDGMPEDRMNTISNFLMAKAIAYGVDYVVMEEPPMVAKNSALTIQKMAGLYYVIMCKFRANNMLVVPVMPSCWRKALNIKAKGRIEQKKASIQYASDLKGTKLSSDDEADAICISQYGQLTELEVD